VLPYFLVKVIFDFDKLENLSKNISENCTKGMTFQHLSLCDLPFRFTFHYLTFSSSLSIYYPGEFSPLAQVSGLFDLKVLNFGKFLLWPHALSGLNQSYQQWA